MDRRIQNALRLQDSEGKVVTITVAADCNKITVPLYRDHTQIKVVDENGVEFTIEEVNPYVVDNFYVPLQHAITFVRPEPKGANA
jgi:hypothetical protein